MSDYNEQRKDLAARIEVLWGIFDLAQINERVNELNFSSWTPFGTINSAPLNCSRKADP